MTSYNFIPEDFGLKKGYLYEIIATTYSLKEDGKSIKPNASCMGIRLIDDNLIQIKPFPNTNTFKNLKETNLIAINFVDDIYVYALAALKGADTPIDYEKNLMEFYEFKYFDSLYMGIPVINNAWGFLIGHISQELQEMKLDNLGDVI